MEQNKEIEFVIMATFPELLFIEIEDYNKYHGTNFQFVEVDYAEVPFCKIKVSKYKISDIFSLGYGLAATQYTKRANGEIDW